jgi:CDP-glycerol glycerophosphotransferase (TagB/SpsB family)
VNVREKQANFCIGLMGQIQHDTDWCTSFDNALRATGLDYEIWLRRHPLIRAHGSKQTHQLAGRFVNVEDVPMHDILPALDCMVTGYSSVTIEALVAQIPLVSASESGRFFLDPYFKHFDQRLFLSNGPVQAAQSVCEAIQSSNTAELERPDSQGFDEVVGYILQRQQ